MKARGFVYWAGCTLVLAGCSNGKCDTFTSALSIEDRMSQEANTFAVGEPIEFKMTVTNNRDAPATLTYPDNCPPIRFLVFDSSQSQVFDSFKNDADSICAQQIVPFDYEPKETKTFSREWNQTRSDNGSQVQPGQFAVDARERSFECGGDLDKAKAFTIQ